MRLRDIMSVGVVTVDPDEPAEAALAEMRRQRIRHLVVVDRDRVVGLVSERDLGGRRGARFRASRTVRDVMTPEPVSATPATTLRQAANLMRGRTIGCLLVVDDDGTLAGLVTTTDLLDQLGRGAARPTVRTEPAPVRRAPGAGAVRGKKNIRRATGPRRGRRGPRRTGQPTARPGSLRRRVKVSRSRTLDAAPPVHIRVIGAELDQESRDTIVRQLGRKLEKFASSIERVSVRLLDVNGPKGGVDQMCRVKVVLRGLPSVLVERQDAALPNAIDGAIRSTALAVGRSIRRRRLKPLDRRRPSPLRPAS